MDEQNPGTGMQNVEGFANDIDAAGQGGDSAPKELISNTQKVFLVGTAILFDLLSIVLPAVMSIVAAVVFGIWFLILKLPLLSPKKLVTQALALFGESVPAISILPFITIGVMLMISMEKIKEKTGVDAFALVSKGRPSASGTASTAAKQAVRPSMNDMLPSTS